MVGFEYAEGNGYSDREFNEVLSEYVKEAIKEALHTGTEKKPNPAPQEFGYRTRAETRRMLGVVAYYTIHYWEKAGILVPHRIGRKVYYSDEAIREALAKNGRGKNNGLSIYTDEVVSKVIFEAAFFICCC